MSASRTYSKTLPIYAINRGSKTVVMPRGIKAVSLFFMANLSPEYVTEVDMLRTPFEGELFDERQEKAYLSPGMRYAMQAHRAKISLQRED
jgi:hypothetical protein